MIAKPMRMAPAAALVAALAGLAPDALAQGSGVAASAGGVPLGAAPGQAPGLAAPKPPAPRGPAPVIAPPAPPSPPPQGRETGAPLIGALKGLVFVPSAQALKPDGVAEAAAGPDGVAAPQLPMLEGQGFVAEMKAHLGKPLRLGDIQQVRDETKAWYAAHDHPFVEVAIPPQDIASGVVQVVVAEYRLGEVVVTGARYFRDSLILKSVGLKPGQTISLRQLTDTVDRLNENPFLSVDAAFKPGKAPDLTDLHLEVTDRMPVRVYAGYDNQGVATLDADEWDAGVNWGNVFGAGQIASYQYTRAMNGRFTSHAASDVIRLDDADRLLVFGNYAIMRSAALVGPLEFDANGHALQASVRLVRTLPKLFGGALSGHIQIGYDYKSTDNNAFFDQVQLGAPSVMETNQFPIVYDGAEADRFGSTAIENDLVVAPGRITARDNDADFDTLVAGAKASYVYDRLSATRIERMPMGASLIVRAILQRSSAILPDSEQLGGGGVGSVRGYHPDTGLGSNGELLSLEVRAPAFSPGRLLRLTGLDDLAQVGAFYDYASLRQPYYPQDVAFGSASNGAVPVDLASAGVLAHYSISRHVDVNLDLGWRMRTTPDSGKLGDYAAIAIVFSR